MNAGIEERTPVGTAAVLPDGDHAHVFASSCPLIGPADR
jgi:hypothetical protein